MAVPYPSTLPNPLYKGKQDLPAQGFFVTQMDYATKRRPKNSGNFIVNVSFLYNKAEMAIFWNWYLLDINNGARQFEATWDIAGATILMQFAISHQGHPKITPIGLSYEVTMKVEVKSDIYELLALNNLNGFCPDIIECQDSLIDFAVNYTT